MELPDTIAKVVSEDKNITVPHDTVFEELKGIADRLDFKNEEIAMAMAVYMLGFSTYLGFENCITFPDFQRDENVLNRLYKYAKKFS